MNLNPEVKHARDGGHGGWSWLEHLFRDLRYAVRQLRKTPGFAVTSILTVAVGIGSCTALFSVVNGVLLQPLRLDHPERIVTVAETRLPNRNPYPIAPAEYLDWAKQASVFEYLALRSGRSFNTVVGDRATSVGAFAVTASYFSVLGIEPIRGRVFLPEEEEPGKNRVAVISSGAWKSQFGGRDDVIGQTVLLNDQSFTIVGVLPDRNMIWNANLFVPLAFSPTDRGDYGSHGLACIGRLKPDVTVDQAQADMDVVSDRIAHAHADSNLHHGSRVTPLLEDLTGNVRQQLIVLLSAVGFVLLIACVNVASLLLARANSRQREIAMRAALGASRGRIVRQFLSESLLIAVIGGGLGILIAYVSLGAVAQFAGRYVPRTEEITLDGSVLGLARGLMVLAGLGVGLIPALQFTRGDMAEPLKDAGRGASSGRHRLRSALVVTEIALAMMLLAATGLLARSLMELQRADQGFNGDNVFISRVALGGKKYDSAEKGMAFVNEVTARVSALPAVEAITFSTGLPLTGVQNLYFTVDGAPQVPIKDMPHVNDYVVSPDYFKAMSIPLVRGRGFTAQDMGGAQRVVIINQELARRHFSGVDPIGQRLMILTVADKPDAVREIVGVVGDIRPYGPQSEIAPQAYEPLRQRPQGGLNVILKTKASGGPATVSDIIRELDSDLPFRNMRTFDEIMAGAWVRQKFSMILFTWFAGIALLLAAIGIYGVMAYSVNQRTREIGVRMALGATLRDMISMVLRQGIGLTLLGCIVGIAGATMLNRFIASLLYGVKPADPLTFIAVTGLFMVVALLACWLPARRAARVNPLDALRAEYTSLSAAPKPGNRAPSKTFRSATRRFRRRKSAV